MSHDQRYVLIHTIIKKYELHRMVNYLCKVAEVSKSGYYRYWTFEAQQKRSQREQQDEQVKEIILKAYHFK
ncbi:IS3 family transposase, partial [Paenibacillus sp. 2RAB27]